MSKSIDRKKARKGSFTTLVLLSEEIEVLKLYNIDGFSQIDVAKKMNISQPTVARILKRTYKKISKAVLKRKVIKIRNID